MNTIDHFTGKYRFLSNFWPSVVVYDGVFYPSTEHAYQASKTLDKETRKLIQAAATPGLAKKMGRKATMRPDWEEIKLSVMEDLVTQKFRDDELREKLLDTRGAELVETNHWHDCYWGVCDGVGENHLGKILMAVRFDIWFDRLREYAVSYYDFSFSAAASLDKEAYIDHYLHGDSPDEALDEDMSYE